MFLYEGVFGVYYPPPHLTPFPLPPSPTPNQPHPPTHIPQLQATPDKGLFLVRFVFCIHSKLLMFPAVFVKAAVAEGKAVWVFVFIDCVVYSSVCVPWAIIPSGLGVWVQLLIIVLLTQLDRRSCCWDLGNLSLTHAWHCAPVVLSGAISCSPV